MTTTRDPIHDDDIDWMARIPSHRRRRVNPDASSMQHGLGAAFEAVDTDPAARAASATAVVEPARNTESMTRPESRPVTFSRVTRPSSFAADVSDSRDGFRAFHDRRKPEVSKPHPDDPRDGYPRSEPEGWGT